MEISKSNNNNNIYYVTEVDLETPVSKFYVELAKKLNEGKELYKLPREVDKYSISVLIGSQAPDLFESKPLSEFTTGKVPLIVRLR